MLHRVMDATKLPDGRIVVANNGTHELRVFDAAGTHVATWGGRGEGPAEFLEMWQVERWPGDSIAAWYAPPPGNVGLRRARQLRAHLLAGGGRRALHLRRPHGGRLGPRDPPSRRRGYDRRAAQGCRRPGREFVRDASRQ